MKKGIIIVILLLVISFIIVYFVSKNEYKGLEVYSLRDKEDVVKKFNYKNRDYILTTYHNDLDTYASNNILIKDHNKYYLLGEVNKCDMSYYLKDNNIYIHCIGKKGEILKYTINGTKLEKEIINLDYTNTPNISQIHIMIDKVDKDNIYLISNVKNKENIKNGENVICSLKTNECYYS